MTEGQIIARWIAFAALIGQTLGLLVVPFLVPAPRWFGLVVVAQLLVDACCVRLALRPHPSLVGATAAAPGVARKADDGDQPQPPPTYLTASSFSSSFPASPIAGPVVPGSAEALGIEKGFASRRAAR